MHATAGSMSATAEETSRQATSVATASELASTNVQTVAAATEQLHASISEISRQVTQSAEFASTAVVEADRTNATIQGLADTAQKIGEVVSLIQNIASQTNLLALNATIAAARAGESGRGFAVVASEVKALASQTAKATEDISTQIAAIQGETGHAVEAIKAIGGTIRQMNEIASAIAAAVEATGGWLPWDISHNISAGGAGAPMEWPPNVARVNEVAEETGAAATPGAGYRERPQPPGGQAAEKVSRDRVPRQDPRRLNPKLDSSAECRPMPNLDIGSSYFLLNST